MKKINKKLFDGVPDSQLSLNDLIELSKRPFFKTSIEERRKKVGKVKYSGFKYVLHRDDIGKIRLFVNLYFLVQGAKNEVKTKYGKKEIRRTYLAVIKFPYYKRIKNFRRLYETPIQIFASDPSFKYYFAYVLNVYGAVVLDDITFVRHLKKALSQPPVKNNPNWKIQLTKHLFKIVKFLATQRPSNYLSPKYELPDNKTFKIINEHGEVGLV